MDLLSSSFFGLLYPPPFGRSPRHWFGQPRWLLEE
jgi:hypothetical protein